MQNLNDNVTSTLDTSSRSDRRILILHRALMLVPWILIVAGLIGDPLNRLVEPVGSVVIILAFLALIPFLFWVKNSMLKDNPRLKKALLNFVPGWTLKQFRQQWGVGLDEREKLVIDQALRTSYQILAFVCIFVIGILIINIDLLNPFGLHLSYSLGRPDSFEGFISPSIIMLGSLCVLAFLPATIAAWKEGM